MTSRDALKEKLSADLHRLSTLNEVLEAAASMEELYRHAWLLLDPIVSRLQDLLFESSTTDSDDAFQEEIHCQVQRLAAFRMLLRGESNAIGTLNSLASDLVDPIVNSILEKLQDDALKGGAR